VFRLTNGLAPSSHVSINGVINPSKLVMIDFSYIGIIFARNLKKFASGFREASGLSPNPVNHFLGVLNGAFLEGRVWGQGADPSTQGSSGQAPAPLTIIFM
jgi:hypothetical protein